jgi:restriction system protein
MRVPDYRQLMQPTLEALEKAGGELEFDELVLRLSSYLDLDETAARKPLNSGNETVFLSNVRWAVSYLAAAGNLRFSGDDGEVQLINTVIESAPGFAETATPFELGEPEDIDETIGKLFSRASKRLKQSLMGRIYAREPEFFEQLILDLLLAMGYGGTRVDLTRRIS